MEKMFTDILKLLLRVLLDHPIEFLSEFLVDHSVVDFLDLHYLESSLVCDLFENERRSAYLGLLFQNWFLFLGVD